jgi:UDP-N-acetylglucosamine 2-epimerase (hydrolysing)
MIIIIVVYPNNDFKVSILFRFTNNLKNNNGSNFLPCVLSTFNLTQKMSIIGNSSAGIREAPYYGLPIINIGTRQQNRAVHADIVDVDFHV